MCIKPKLRHNLSIKTNSGVYCVFLSLFTAGFAGLPTPLTCLDGLRYMLNFNISFAFYQPPANVYHAETR